MNGFDLGELPEGINFKCFSSYFLFPFEKEIKRKNTCAVAGGGPPVGCTGRALGSTE